jgi:nucleoid-associated protein YgaU
MSKAWIALSLAPALVLFGCKSEPEPVAMVPPPDYAAEPEPLPPVSINQGSTLGTDPGTTGGPQTDPSAGPGSYEPEPLPPSQPATRTYTIRKGDTLWSIAKREYGNGQRWVDISALNPSIDPKKLVIGKQIILP